LGSFFSEPTTTSHPGESIPITARGGWTLGVLLAATFAIRAIRPDQPIVENYVGRQVPTAMVARNLERGSGFLRPELDTGPFPNLFLVEPPIYEQVVASFRPILGFDPQPTGRLVSAAAVALGAWGLFGLARRREGRTVALLAVGSFAVFPVTVRYGRAFQPDALMLGFVLAGLRGWDEFEATGRGRWAAFGGFVLATGLALKITSAWALIPFVIIVRRWPVAWRLAASGAMLVPAFAWYVHAWGDVARPTAGSLASSDNAAIWIRTLGPSSWLRFSTWSNVGWSLVIRSFTPVGFVLAALGCSESLSKWLACVGWVERSEPHHAGLVGLAALDPPYTPLLRSFTPAGFVLAALGSFGKPRLDRLWVGWLVGCGLAIAVLAAKWHHAYYWMVVAPIAAVGVARGLVALAGRGRWGFIASVTLGSFFLALCAVQSASTWRTPPEWSNATEAALEIRDVVPEEAGLIAPEALLYLSDRRGFRLEFEPSAVARAAGELGMVLEDPDRPLALVELYRDRGGPILPVGARGPTPRDVFYGSPPPRFVADIGPAPGDARRKRWRDAIRAHPDIKILVDRPDLLIAEFR
jgi:Dolichyl-phosphate-mannose-protein mannosyltransferase